jgi:hypothetical protein
VSRATLALREQPVPQLQEKQDLRVIQVILEKLAHKVTQVLREIQVLKATLARLFMEVLEHHRLTWAQLVHFILIILLDGYGEKYKISNI